MATTLTVRLDDRLYAELAALAAARGSTLSELARRTLSALVTVVDDDGGSGWVGPSEFPDSLTTIKRHELALLHRVAAQLHEGDSSGIEEYHLRAADVFERGFTVEYSDILEALEPELSRRDAELVMDILEMYTQLQSSFDQLSSAQQKALGGRADRAVRFFGFDLNDRFESRLLRYARHLIDQDRWRELAVYFDDRHERGNSHMPSIATYQRMLTEFNPIWRRKIREMGDYQLTADEIKQVIDAKIHPDNR